MSAVSTASQLTPPNNRGSLYDVDKLDKLSVDKLDKSSDSVQLHQLDNRQEHKNSFRRLDTGPDSDLEEVNRALGISETERPSTPVKAIAVVIDELTSQAMDARVRSENVRQEELRPPDEKTINNHSSRKSSANSSAHIPVLPIQADVQNQTPHTPKDQPTPLERSIPERLLGHADSSDTLQTPIIARKRAASSSLASSLDLPFTKQVNIGSNHYEGSNGFVAGKSSLARKLNANVSELQKEMRHTHFDPNPKISETPVALSVATTPSATAIPNFAFREESPQVQILPLIKKGSGLFARMSLRASAIAGATRKARKSLQSQLSTTSMEEFSEAAPSSSGSLPDVSTAPSCSGYEVRSPNGRRKSSLYQNGPTGSFRDPKMSLSLLHGTTQIAAHVHNTLMVKSSGSSPYPRSKSPRHLSPPSSPSPKMANVRPRAQTADPPRQNVAKDGGGSPLLRNRGKHVKKDSRQKMISKRERRAVRTVVVVTSAFCICWLPFFLFALLSPWCEYFGVPICGIPEYVPVIINWLGYLNSLINPLIYTTVRALSTLEIRLTLTRQYEY